MNLNKRSVLNAIQTLKQRYLLKERIKALAPRFIPYVILALFTTSVVILYLRKGNVEKLSWLVLVVTLAIAAVWEFIDIKQTKRLELEREHLLEQLKRETKDLAALTEVTTTAISTLNLNELLTGLLKRIAAVTQADIAAILLKKNNSFTFHTTIGIEREIVANFAFPAQEGVVGMIAETMQPIYIENAQTDLRVVSQFFKKQGIHTILGLPLKHDGNLVGVLHVNWLSIHAYNAREMHLLEIAAERCAMAIINAQLYEETKHLQEFLQLQINHMPGGCILHDRDFHITDWNPGAERIFGYSKAEVLGKRPHFLFPKSEKQQIEKLLQQVITTDTTQYSVNENVTKDHRTIICEWYNIPIRQADDKFIGYLAMVQDITSRKQTQDQLWKYAFYDTLTELPNRTFFLERLEEAIACAEITAENNNHSSPLTPQHSAITCQNRHPLFAVLFLDLERFQLIKYSLGHIVAEQLLVSTARRLESCLCSKEQLARVGLNEFAILLTDLEEVSDATRMANRLYQHLTSPFNLNGHEIVVNPTIGIALSDIDYDRPEDLLRAADTAMHQAKSLGKSRYALFDPAMQTSALARFKLETELRRALERQELRVYYQPIISLPGGEISGFEALVRWKHPTRGVISPVEFIPLAEEAGLISFIDQWVLQEACRQVSIWQAEFPTNSPLTMSVNLSALHLSQLGLIERLDQILRDTGIKGSNLKLELTESLIMENPTVSVAMLEQLKGLGIKLSIDDFGTGYSSLARLHQLPIDTLKIDRSFVVRMGEDEESFEIVRTIIALAHTLNMDVTAEGVETDQQLAQLQKLNCEYGQGYFFSHPVDSETARNLIATEGNSEKFLDLDITGY